MNREGSLEEDMATHCSILAWRIPWTEKPSGLQAMGSHLDTMKQLSIHLTPCTKINSKWLKECKT